MTEADWLACDDLRRMLAYLLGRASDRKLRLFGVACCRRAGYEPRHHRALETLERYADGEATESELAEFRLETFPPPADASRVARAVHVLAAKYVAPFVQLAADYTHAGRRSVEPSGEVGQCDLLRDIFRHRSRLVVIDPRWLTITAVALARLTYADRAFDRLPILADALEDAGCDRAELLAHLRGEGPHVRGCWALDLVLGKG